jgi:acetyl-CoA carboxylase carboxyl transferase subunit alpha
MDNLAYERVQEARNPRRPYALDLFETIFEGFTEIHGDRRFSDDAAMVCGFGKIDGIEVCIIGEQKGRDMNQRRFRNFGMPKPEGYRKSLRLMYLAQKFNRPIITFIDTPGAYPGIDAEERGQAEAIAFNLREMANLKVPILVVVLGEGGSGGALAIGIGDWVLMLENSVYSVISPEGCAAILWKDSAKAAKASEELCLTAENLLELGIIDEIIREHIGSEKWEITEISESSAENLDPVLQSIKLSLVNRLKFIQAFSTDKLLSERYNKFRRMGVWLDK